MPTPSGDVRCAFQGIASGVHVRGIGPATIADKAAFSGPGALKVELVGVQIGAVKHTVVDRPAELEPVRTAAGAPYELSYWAGKPTVVRIDEGGKPGVFRGELAGAPECAAKPCAVEWTGRGKMIALHRDGDQPVEITGALPSGEGARLDVVTLQGATGTLRCGGEETAIRGETVRWTLGERGTLELLPMRVEGATLHVDLRSDAGPVRLSRLILGGEIITVLLIGGAIAFALHRTRKRPPAPPPREG